MGKGSIKNQIFHPKTDKIRLLARLKNESTLENFNKKIKPALSHPITKSLIDATSSPKTLSELRKSRPVPYSNNIEGEIAWILYSLELKKDSVIKYIKLKERFEYQILAEKFEDAIQTIEKINSEVGVSLWGIESMILTKELSLGSEENWKTLSKMAKELKDPLALFYLENVSKRIEKKVSYIRYRTIFSSQINENQGSIDRISEYLCFKLNYTAYLGYQNFPFFLNVESTSSIIDRYNIVIDVINELIPHNDKDINSICKEVISKLHNSFELDFRVKQLYFLTTGKAFEKSKAESSTELIFNKYTIGEYEFVIEESKTLLKSYPNHFELYEIYVKSLIELKLPFKKSEASIAIDNILEHLYNFLSRNKNYEDSYNSLMKLIISYGTLSWSKQLFSIISQYTNMDSEKGVHHISYFIHSQIVNPKIYAYKNFWMATQGINNSLEEDENKLSLATIINTCIGSGDYKRIENYNEIPSIKKSLYIGRALITKKKFLKLKDRLEKISLIDINSNISIEEFTFQLLTCYIELDEFEKAIKLFVNIFIKNKHLTSRLPKLPLLNEINKNQDVINNTLLIEYPIFIHLSIVDPYERYVAYDIFMNSKNISKPSQLFNEKADKKLIYFLKEVCSPEILNYSINFESSDEIYKERQEILKWLLGQDSVNESSYIKELTEISEEISVKEVLREVNKGRISINSQRLKKLEETNIEEGYSRFQDILKYSKSNDLIGLDTSTKEIRKYLDSLNDTFHNKNIIHTNDPAYISFKQMFTEIRDKFLFDTENGLDGYLSTRIRHGTFLNHIRSVFESLNLMSQKNKNGVYLDNEYWNRSLPQSLLSKKIELQECIKSFSNEIDNLTIDIIEERIQIKTEKSKTKNLALFNYSINEKQFAYLFQVSKDNINDYKSFLDFVFTYLEELTEQNLESIRSFLTKKLISKYSEHVNQFEKDIKSILSGDSFSELTSSIMKCRTNLQFELNSIAEWFRLANPSTDLTKDIKTLIQTGIEITNTIHPNRQIKPKINCESDIPIKGTIHIIYIIRILLDNIIHHSGIDEDKLEVDIKSEYIESKSILRLSFENPISKKVDQNKIKENLKKAKKKWIDSSGEFDKINVEGGSGIEKIKKIITVDLNSKKDDFNFEVKEHRVKIDLDIGVNIINET